MCSSLKYPPRGTSSQPKRNQSKSQSSAYSRSLRKWRLTVHVRLHCMPSATQLHFSSAPSAVPKTVTLPKDHHHLHPPNIELLGIYRTTNIGVFCVRSLQRKWNSKYYYIHFSEISEIAETVDLPVRFLYLSRDMRIFRFCMIQP